MLNRKWIARSCFSLSILSMFMLSVCAQETPLAQSCQNDDSLKTSEINLRRQIESQPPPLTTNSNAKIASINLKQLNVFNTELEAENNALFRFANRAHIQTEPEVIKSILLFKAGDTFNQKTLAESERLLRKQNRSEEHTSELQSRLSLSYAVFCLKKIELLPNILIAISVE